MCGSNSVRARRGYANNQWRKMGFCVFVHLALSVPTVYKKPTISSWFLQSCPQRSGCHRLISPAFLPCSDCAQSPQAYIYYYYDPTKQHIGFLPDATFSYNFPVYLICNLSLCWKCHTSDKESHTSSGLCRIPQSSPGSLMCSVTRTTKICPSTIIYDLMCHNEPQFMIRL